MNHEERRRRIAEAAYLRSERRGFAGDQQLDDWLAAERELAALIDAEAGEKDSNPETARGREDTSGVSTPAPLAQDERIRTEEVRQSAHDLSVATATSPEKQAARKPAAKKNAKRAARSGSGSDSRRSL